MSKAYESFLNNNRRPSFAEEMEEWGKAPNYKLEFSDGKYFGEQNDTNGETLVLYRKVFADPGSYESFPIMTEEIFKMCYERWIVAKGLDR